jgi:hypothetical protein
MPVTEVIKGLCRVFEVSQSGFHNPFTVIPIRGESDEYRSKDFSKENCVYARVETFSRNVEAYFLKLGIKGLLG